MLGSTLCVGNHTEAEQIVELNIDTAVFNYNRKDIIREFSSLDVPFSLIEDCKESIVNSEVKTESWWIENPVSKDLTKRITIKLGPKAEQEFVLVLKAP